MKSPKELKHEADHIEDCLITIGILAEVLLNNNGYKGDADCIDKPPQINDRGESGIQQAIQMLAGVAHREFCRMASDLEIPACK